MARLVAILVLALACGCAPVERRARPSRPDPSACGEGVRMPAAAIDPDTLPPDLPNLTRPVFLSGPNPRYTQAALDRAVEGRLVARCVISAEGTVRDCCVRQGLPLMNAAVIGALQQRRYRPAMKDGRPIDVWYWFFIDLRLPR